MEHPTEPARAAHSSRPPRRGHYGRLALMSVLSFVAMFVLMYAMVHSAGDALPNINQAYMAGLMTAAMVLIELALMRMMYPDRRVNAAIALLGVAALIACFLAIRQQTFVSDRAFLTSMIPHHSAAILMCEQAAIDDREIAELCASIVQGQQAEIDQMRAILDRMDR